MIRPTRSIVVPTAVSIVLLFGAGVLTAVSGLPVADDARVTAEVEIPQPPAAKSPRAESSDSLPTVVDIPVIAVSAPIDALGLTETGELAVPEDFGRVGWWSRGSIPGQPGPAVLVGHFDNETGPAVFFKLKELQPGQEVRVGRADGSTTRFVVERSASFPKDRFPTDEVYGPTDDVALRLVTCGGRFDRAVGHYDDNLVVFATRRP